MTDANPTRLLVVANETVVGKPLIDAVKARAEKGAVHVHVICPQNQPRADYDEIIMSTHPETRSGWLRRDLIERVKQATRRPVEHVVVDDPADDRGKETLVVANQTVEDQHLLDLLKSRASDGQHRFVLILPQGDGSEGDPYERLAHVLRRLEEEGVDAVGQVVHPDPFTAIQNAVRWYPVDDIIISTFSPEKSGWLRADLVGRVRSATGKPVEHVVAGQTQSTTAQEGQAA